MNKRIELYPMQSHVMSDAIDRVIVELHELMRGRETKSLLMTGCGPGNGTTTLAINLAIALSMSAWKTLLVDCDLRKEKKFKRLGEKTQLGLSDYLLQKAEPEDIVYGTNYDLLEYIPSGFNAGNPVRLFCSRRMEEFIRTIKGDYEYVIFDLPSLNIVSDARILFSGVDGILLVAALQQTTKKQLADARLKVDEFGEKYCGLLVNKVELGQYRKHIKDYDYFKAQNVMKRFLSRKVKKAGK